jgi:hypothetical protein
MTKDETVGVQDAATAASAHDASAGGVSDADLLTALKTRTAGALGVGELEDLLKAARADYEGSLPARRLEALKLKVEKQRAHLAGAEARLAQEMKEQGLR